MEAFSEKEFARRLQGFEAVWQRVRRGRPGAAEAPGVKLMPRKSCRGRRGPGGRCV